MKIVVDSGPRGWDRVASAVIVLVLVGVLLALFSSCTPRGPDEYAVIQLIGELRATDPGGDLIL